MQITFRHAKHHAADGATRSWLERLRMVDGPLMGQWTMVASLLALLLWFSWPSASY